MRLGEQVGISLLIGLSAAVLVVDFFMRLRSDHNIQGLRGWKFRLPIWLIVAAIALYAFQSGFLFSNTSQTGLENANEPVQENANTVEVMLKNNGF